MRMTAALEDEVALLKDKNVALKSRPEVTRIEEQVASCKQELKVPSEEKGVTADLDEAAAKTLQEDEVVTESLEQQGRGSTEVIDGIPLLLRNVVGNR